MVKRQVLPNGIRVIMQRMPEFRSVAMGAWIAAGAVYEQEQEAGVSHFIEHMLFKGTQTRSAVEIAATMDGIGGNLNAFTAKECTCYYVKVLDEHIGVAVDVLSDMLLHPKLDPGDIEKEQGVVCEEILMVQDTPEDLVHEMLASAMYENTPLSKPILGSQQSVRVLTRESLQGYMNRHYCADSIVIACAGNFEEEALIALLSEKLQDGCGQRKSDMPESTLRTGRSFQAAEKDIEQVHIAMGLRGFAADTDQLYAMLILNNAFGGSMSSRLFQTIREERGLAYSVYSYPSSYNKTGYFALYAGTGEKQAPEVVQLMLEEIEKLRRDGITKEEFTRSKEQLKGGYMLGQESTSARANAIGKSELLRGMVYTDEQIMARIERVSMDDVMDILPEVLNLDNGAASFVGRMSAQAKQIEQMLQ